MTNIEGVNKAIQTLRNAGISVKEISDGHHTFGQYIEMRNCYFIELCNAYPELSWKSRNHFNEEEDPMFNDDFIAGINTPAGTVSQHLKMIHWDELRVREIDRAPKYVGYTEEDIKIRIRSLSK
jgi:hypothetical protein